MSKAKRCGKQVGVPQQARRAWIGDKKQGSTYGKKAMPKSQVWILRILLLMWLG
jgi:hypothetical protein